MTLNTYLYRGRIYITFLSICPVSNHKNASKRQKYPKQWLHKRNKQTRSHTESIVLYLRRICVCPGVFIYFGVGAACGWIVWVCLCCVSFLFGVFKETQHSKCLCSLSPSRSLRNCDVLQQFWTLGVGSGTALSWSIAQQCWRTAQLRRKYGTAEFRSFSLCVCVSEWVSEWVSERERELYFLSTFLRPT